MNFRYLAAVGISLIIHASLLWSVPEKKAFAMPTGSQSSQVNITFVAPSIPTPSQPKEKVTPPKKAAKKPAQVVKKTPTKKKAVSKKKPVPKNKTPKKSIVKKPEKVAKSTPNHTAEAATPPKKKEQTKKTVTEKSITAPTVSKSGATEKPQLITQPSFLKRPSAPRYPRIARRKGIEGTALYEIWLNEKGKQVKQELITSSGTKVLDDAALKAIRNWQFSPQIINGQAIAHRVQIPVRFSLN